MRVLLLALYSPLYPAIGETHGLSTIAGALRRHFHDSSSELMVVDMVGLRDNREDVAISLAESFRPDIIGLSLTYGSYDVLRRLYPRLKGIVEDSRRMILGGVLATYIPEILLSAIDSLATVICGEGEEAIVGVIDAIESGHNFDGIPNVITMGGTGLQRNPRRLVNVDVLPPPYRDHIEELASNGAQVFVESSRGCSWAACTFCLRGLTDIEGRKSEYRRFPMARLESDLNSLYAKGIRSVTFADEDFLGGLKSGLTAFVDALSVATKAVHGMRFDASLTIRSIFDHRWTADEHAERILQLRRLREIGLRKVFLGIESASAPQLKRYAKGHSAEEALQACKRVIESGMVLEIGFIMFDPLCSLDDVADNIEFFSANDLVGYVSFFCNEMRLQVGSRYFELLEKRQSEESCSVLTRELDLNTLTYKSSYADPIVDTLVSIARVWNATFRKLHYPLKNLSRYGDGGALKKIRPEAVEIISTMRRGFLQIFGAAVIDCKSSGGVFQVTHDAFRLSMKSWADQICGMFDRHVGDYVETEVVTDLIAEARGFSRLL